MCGRPAGQLGPRPACEEVVPYHAICMAPRSRKPPSVEGDLSAPAARALRQFRIIFNAVRTHFRAVEKKAGIAGAQVWALHVIQAKPGITVSQLSRAMDIHQSTASNLLRPLIEQGFVVSERAQADKRLAYLQLTSGGAKALKKAPGPFAGVLPEALMQLDATTLNRLTRDLGRLVVLLGADEEKGNLPLGSRDS